MGYLVDGFITNVKELQRKEQLKNTSMKHTTSGKKRRSNQSNNQRAQETATRRRGNQNRSRSKIQKIAKDS